MKKIILFLLASFCLFLSSCGEKETIEELQKTSEKLEATLNGKWHLKKTTAPRTKKTTTYEKEEIVWIFDEKSKTIKVVASTKQNLSGLDSGNYGYEIKQNKNFEGRFLYVNGTNLGLLKLDKESLKIDHSYVDGLLKEFSR